MAWFVWPYNFNLFLIPYVVVNYTEESNRNNFNTIMISLVIINLFFLININSKIYIKFLTYAFNYYINMT